MVLPNTFILGVQKAGTTSLHYWLSQHPDIYGPNEIKDKNLLIDQGKNIDTEDAFHQVYKSHKSIPVRLYTYVNSIFYPDALKKIASVCPSARIIIILRNPIQRSFSAYKYFQKRRRETRTIKAALLYKPKYPLPYSNGNSDFSYIEHGLYSLQIEYCLKYFDRKHILILDFEELISSPREILRKVYLFLDLKRHFTPAFDAKNVTGDIRSKKIQKILLESSPLRKWIISNFVEPWWPEHKRKLFKKNLIEWNTKKNVKTDESKDYKDFIEIIPKLKEIYVEDVKRLDSILGTKYITKWGLEDLSTKV